MAVRWLHSYTACADEQLAIPTEMTRGDTCFTGRCATYPERDRAASYFERALLPTAVSAFGHAHCQKTGLASMRDNSTFTGVFQ